MIARLIRLLTWLFPLLGMLLAGACSLRYQQSQDSQVLDVEVMRPISANGPASDPRTP